VLLSLDLPLEGLEDLLESLFADGDLDCLDPAFGDLGDHPLDDCLSNGPGIADEERAIILRKFGCFGLKDMIRPGSSQVIAETGQDVDPLDKADGIAVDWAGIRSEVKETGASSPTLAKAEEAKVSICLQEEGVGDVLEGRVLDLNLPVAVCGDSIHHGEGHGCEGVVFFGVRETSQEVGLRGDE